MLSSIKLTLKRSTPVRILFYLILGGFLISQPNRIITISMYVLAAYFLISGIEHLFSAYNIHKKLNMTSSDLLFGIVKIILALTLFFFYQSILAFFPIIIGLMIIFEGILQFIESFSPKDIFGIIYSILLVIVGFVLLFNPFGTMIVFTRFLGCWLLIMAISEVIIYFRIKKLH